MKKIFLALAFLLLAFQGVGYTARQLSLYPSLDAVDAVINSALNGKINLQASTPGTPQTGNLNIQGFQIIGADPPAGNYFGGPSASWD